MDRTSPHGRVIGIDIIPAQPPKGVSTIQGNFLSAAVQEEVKIFLRDPGKSRLKQSSDVSIESDQGKSSPGEVDKSTTLYEGFEKKVDIPSILSDGLPQPSGRRKPRHIEEADGRMVDIVLSDMSAPWEQTTGFWKKSLSNPYFRMMNTSGMSFRDHAGSMVRPSLSPVFE